MKILNDAMKDMKITNNFEDLYFFMQISQRCCFGGLGEDQNIALAIERWKIISRWKTPLIDRCISVTFLHHRSILKNPSEVLKTTDWQDKAKGFHSVSVGTLKD